jgi:AraC family transcriptional regulator, transcriptional activator of pobA
MGQQSTDNSLKSAIPVVDFYGETTDWPVADLIHCEHLQVRSALHDWQIKPHRHQGLLQIFYVQEGSGQAQVDSTDLAIGAHSLLVVPEMCVHKFMWEANSKGFVLFIAKPLLARLDQFFGTQHWGATHAAVHATASDSDFIENTFATIASEYRQNQRKREQLLETLITALCIWINRQQEDSPAPEYPGGKSEQRYENFRKLVETHYMKQHTVAWYAARVGISPPHLNSICQRLQGRTALEIIHQRILLEAQRSLIYTSRTAVEISDQLGFSEPSYFNRFFKRLTGTTPRLFRQHALSS